MINTQWFLRAPALSHQSQGDLIISSQKLSSLKDIYCTSAQKRMPSNISDWCVAHLRKVPMFPWPKIANFKYWCPKDICFQSVYRMEITRTSSWGLYYRKDALWTQITTNWEQLCGLKIIKSWRFHFSEQKKSTIGQVIWSLLSNYLFPKNIFWAKRSIESLSKVNLMIPFFPKPIWKLSIGFFLT